MFRLVDKRTAWWPVHFAGVTEEGVIVDNKVELRFVVLDEVEIVDFQGRLTAAGEPLEGENLLPVKERVAAISDRVGKVMLEVVEDWRGVGQENKEPLPFSSDAFLKFLRVSNVPAAIGTAYTHCRAGTREARAGN